MLVKMIVFFFCFQSPVLSYSMLHVSGRPCCHQQFACKHQCFLFSHYSKLCHICFTQIHFNKLWGKDMVYEVVLFVKLSRIKLYLIVLCPCLFPLDFTPFANLSLYGQNCFSYVQPSSPITSHVQL